MRTYEEVEEKNHAFLASPLDECESALRSCHFIQVPFGTVSDLIRGMLRKCDVLELAVIDGK